MAVAILAAALIGRAGAQDAQPAADHSAAPSDPASSGAWAAQIDAARARHDDWLACIRAKRFQCDDKKKPDPMQALLDDDTLVEGDIVATPQGLKVFHGRPGTPHKWADFK